MTYRPPFSAFCLRALCGSFMMALGATNPAFAQAERVEDVADTPARQPAPFRRFHLGTSLFVLYNLVPDDQPPVFANVNVGMRLTPRDTLSLEAITWQYHEPQGTPYGPNKGHPDNAFPGRVVDVGVGVAYQRFLWKGAYVGASAAPFYQIYLDEQGTRIQTGFQLFIAARVGYHFAFANNRIFLEPSAAFTTWPINTNMPGAFAVLDDKWPAYFPIEPGLHAGVKF